MDLLSIDQKNIWHPFSSFSDTNQPLLITSAEGVYLITDDGRKIIDAVSSWWVNIHGHANPHIAKAVARQASVLEHVIFAGFTHEPAIQLSKNLLSILPDNQAKLFFSDNGSTAVEVAVKMALQYWVNIGHPKSKIIALSGAYHGDTFGAMSVGGRSIFTTPFEKHLFETCFLDFPDGTNDNEILDQFEQVTKDHSVAAFIYEPLVQGAAGMRIYNPEVLNKILGRCRDKKILCIADEVFTGFGRTGKIFASDYVDLKPDLIALSKGLTGGTMAMGITTCSDGVVDAFRSSDILKTFFHGHSFTANPIACAAANASFELLQRTETSDQIKMISTAHENFKLAVSPHHRIANIRSLGTILAIELSTDEGTSYTNELRKKIYPFFLEQNILLRPLGNVIYVVPPYVIRQEELQYIYDKITEFINTKL